MEQDEIDKLVDWQLGNTHYHSHLTRQPMITIKDDKKAIRVLMELLKMNNQDLPKPASERAIKYMLDLANARDHEEAISQLPPVWQEQFHMIVKAPDAQPYAQTDVSKFIDLLKGCPQAQAPTQTQPQFTDTYEGGHTGEFNPTRPAVWADEDEAYAIAYKTLQELEDGMYKGPKPNEHIYKVYHTVHGANQQVAKRLIVKEEPYLLADQLDDDYVGISRIKMATATFKYEGKAPLKFLKPSMRLTIQDAMAFGKLYGTCCVCGRTLTNELSIHLGIGPICGNREFGGEFQFMLKQAQAEVAQ
jgi:hypothetical protein